PLSTYLHGARPAPQSFPTRRSSDLDVEAPPKPGSSLSSMAEAEPELLGRARWRSFGRGQGGVRALGSGEAEVVRPTPRLGHRPGDRKSTRLNSSHVWVSYAVVCLIK